MAIDGISASNLRFWGLASGLDVDEIVRGLILAERAPLDRLVQQRQLLEWQQEDLRTINRMLRELDNLAFDLSLESAYNSRKASASDASAVAVTATSGAAVGNHTIVVRQLADVMRLHSDVTIQDGKPLADQFAALQSSGTIKFTITKVGPDGSTETSEQISIDPLTDSVRDLASKINAVGAALGIRASYEPDLGRLFITGAETGEDVKFRFDDLAGGSLDDLFQALGLKDRDGSQVTASSQGNEVYYTGLNAIFDYDGVEQITRTTNQFTAGGVTYTLLEADPAKEIKVAVSQDVDAVVQRIKAFVGKYNEVIEHLNSKLAEPRYRDYPPLTAEQRKELKDDEIKLWEERAKSGLLRNDAMLSGIASALRLALGSVVSVEGSTYTSLSAIGITTGGWEERGILHLDESKLRQALEADPGAIAALFRQDGSGSEQGIMLRVREALKSGMERITNRVGVAGSTHEASAIGRQIGWLNDAIERAEERLAQREAYYYRQFTALEAFMSQANSQSLWLAQAFGGL